MNNKTYQSQYDPGWANNHVPLNVVFCSQLQIPTWVSKHCACHTTQFISHILVSLFFPQVHLEVQNFRARCTTSVYTWRGLVSG